MKPLLLLLLCIGLIGGAAYLDAEPAAAAEDEVAPPELSVSGALPSPAEKAPTPNSNVFYAIPVIGFWLILRRRTRGVRL